jgi:hypothetical protein
MKRSPVFLICAFLASGTALAQGRVPRDNTNRQRDQRQVEQGEHRAEIQAERKAERQQQQAQKQLNGGVRLQGPGPHEGDWLRQHQGMPLEQQQQALRNDPGFQKLPPQRQQQLMNQLQRFSQFTPEQRQTMLQRMETWEHLTPDQRQQALVVWNRFRELPDDRRDEVHKVYQRLMNMPQDRRQQFMNSERFRSMFNDQEREIIAGSLNFGIPAVRMQADQTQPPPRLQAPGARPQSPGTQTQSVPPQK